MIIVRIAFTKYYLSDSKILGFRHCGKGERGFERFIFLSSSLNHESSFEWTDWHVESLVKKDDEHIFPSSILVTHHSQFSLFLGIRASNLLSSRPSLIIFHKNLLPEKSFPYTDTFPIRPTNFFLLFQIP